MTANRRSFLGALGFSAAAGPTLAQEIVTRGSFNSLGLAKTLTGTLDQGKDYFDDSATDESCESTSQFNAKDRQLKNLKQAIKRYNNKLKESSNLSDLSDLSKFLRNVDRLDPDLMSSKSLSLTARIREQALRNLKIERERQLGYANSNLNNALKYAREYFGDSELYDIMLKHMTSRRKTPTFELFVKTLIKNDKDEDDDDY